MLACFHLACCVSVRMPISLAVTHSLGHGPQVTPEDVAELQRWEEEAMKGFRENPGVYNLQGVTLPSSAPPPPPPGPPPSPPPPRENSPQDEALVLCMTRCS